MLLTDNKADRNRRHLVAIAGGIGAGKSVVSSMLRAIGFEVYDCDARAKLLMDSDDDIKNQIAEKISPNAIRCDRSIDRRELAAVVFNQSDKLECLNRIVHGAVKSDLALWASGLNIAFVETAFLYQSVLDRVVDEVWIVDAPKEVRIERVIKRNSISVAEVEARIESQDSFKPSAPHQAIRRIINDGFVAVLPQLELLLKDLQIKE